MYERLTCSGALSLIVAIASVSQLVPYCYAYGPDKLSWFPHGPTRVNRGLGRIEAHNRMPDEARCFQLQCYHCVTLVMYTLQC